MRIISNVSKGRAVVLSFLCSLPTVLLGFSRGKKSEDPMRFHLKAGLSTLFGETHIQEGGISRQTKTEFPIGSLYGILT